MAPDSKKTVEAKALLDGTPYETVSILGEGSFGKVVLARDKRSDNLQAVKLIERKPDNVVFLQREVKMHWHMDHPHIVRLREVFRAGDTHVGIAMDPCTAGSLLDYLQSHGHSHAGRPPSECRGQAIGWGLHEGMARWFLQQLVLALDYCHSKGVVHRDIKLDNILLERQQDVPLPLVRLADFGFSRQHSVQDQCVSHVGTPAYMSPELVKLWMEGHSGMTLDGDLDEHRTPYDGVKVDVWALGVTLFTLLFYRYPFGAPTGHDLQKAAAMGLGAGHHAGPRVGDSLRPGEKPIENIKRLLAGDLQMTEPITAAGRVVSPGCLELLRAMMHPDPARRLSLKGIMANAWFKELLPQGAEQMNETQLAKERQMSAQGLNHSKSQSLEEVMDVIANPTPTANVAARSRTITTASTG